MIRYFIFFLLILAAGCSTTPRGLIIENVNKPLAMLQESVVNSMPVGLRARSPNGREFLSKFFVPTKDDFKEADTAPMRWFAHVYILGDRRPYNIEVLVKREKRFANRGVLTYRPEGLDLRIASNLKKRIQDELTKSREGVNLIDDFRAF